MDELQSKDKRQEGKRRTERDKPQWWYPLYLLPLPKEQKTITGTK